MQEEGASQNRCFGKDTEPEPSSAFHRCSIQSTMKLLALETFVTNLKHSKYLREIKEISLANYF